MARGRSKSISQAEKVLQVLLTGKEVSLVEINETLGAHIATSRLATYLWELKEIGAEINRTRTGRKISGLQLMNVDKMTEYLNSRFPVEKTAEAPAA